MEIHPLQNKNYYEKLCCGKHNGVLAIEDAAAAPPRMALQLDVDDDADADDIGGIIGGTNVAALEDLPLPLEDGLRPRRRGGRRVQVTHLPSITNRRKQTMQSANQNSSHLLHASKTFRASAAIGFAICGVVVRMVDDVPQQP